MAVGGRARLLPSLYFRGVRLGRSLALPTSRRPLIEGFQFPFELHFTGADRAYLDGLPLSRQARARLQDFIDYALVQIKDDFCTDPAIRPDPSKPLFIRDIFIVDAWGDERWHRIEFTVDDSQAAQGKLVVVFIDHTDGEWRG